MHRVCKLLFAFALIGTPSLALGQVETSKEDEARQAIIAASQSYALAYNERNAENLARLWSETATYVLPDTGETITGRDAIRQMFAELFSGETSSKLSLTIDSIRFITPDVAVETGTASNEHWDGTVDTSKYSAIHVKQGDQWLLDSVHDVNATTAETTWTPLGELEWLIGDWIDESEDAVVETSARWAKNRSFITRSFRVVAKGTDELEGTQVIGWDPVTNHPRSWVFDSDGGFSEGIWQRKGESWVVETSGFTANGEIVKSVQVFGPLDANSFSWQSFGRRVGDELLPDVGEIKVIRKQ